MMMMMMMMMMIMMMMMMIYEQRCLNAWPLSTILHFSLEVT
jgi:hypothetical protein